MGNQALFLKRYEQKFLLNEETSRRFLEMSEDLFVPDKFHNSHIHNIYFDTPDFLLIRRSNDKPVFKEKLRLRTYEAPCDDTIAFCEIKRKVKKLVYKRRICMDYKTAYDYLVNRTPLENSGQISREIDWMFSYYGRLKPAMKISYERESFAAKDVTSPLRLTFDRNIRWSNTNFGQSGNINGNAILPDGYVLMELKVGEAIPMEIIRIFRALSVRRISFSKYGNAYRQLNGMPLQSDFFISGEIKD